ncbi:uncharacterized protein LOC128306875 [Anopheles moucheti]|uniref:uncharacterized protein LOC128306875 n=1 Tax=Anopheles moucheti TaxID=186751 RepID=UPI0022F098E3|nr:uncharacterized protein LOC128306875 [Anopheles moucheti]
MYATEQSLSDSDECDNAMCSNIQRNDWAMSEDEEIISLPNRNSFIVNIFNNVVGTFSKLIRNTAHFFWSTNEQQTNEHDGSTMPAKRRRLNEDADEPSSASSVLIDQACQTDESFVNTASFDLDELPEQQDETDEEHPQETHHANEQPTMTEEDFYDGEIFDPFKYLEQHDRTPVDPARRVTTFMGNRCYRQRQEQMRRGKIGQLFFASHQKPTKNLDTSRNVSDAFSQRPSCIRAACSGLYNKPIPSQHEGSIFYPGFTQYGGASSASTLPRYPFGLNRSSLSSRAESTRGKKRGLDEDDEANPPSQPYLVRRTKELMIEFEKQKAANKLPQMSNQEISDELMAICKRHNLSLSHDMIQEPMAFARDEEKTYPPVSPLINFMP